MNSPSAFGSKKEGAAEANFAATMRNDFIKEKLALQHNVSLLRIPYSRGHVEGNRVCFIQEDIEAFLDMIREVDGSVVMKVDEDLYDKRDKKYK